MSSKRDEHAARRRAWAWVGGAVAWLVAVSWVVREVTALWRGQAGRWTSYVGPEGHLRLPAAALALIVVALIGVPAAAAAAYLYDTVWLRLATARRRQAGRAPGRPRRARRFGLGTLLALAVRPWVASRPRRASGPVPGHWRALLRERCEHYRRLPDQLRGEFEFQVRDFLAQKTITGIEIEVTEDVKLLVAASATSVSVGWEGFTWDPLTEVLVYPQAFDADDYSFATPDYAGQAHPWGIVILSWPSLVRSFEDASTPYHVGVHEFVHLLDLAGGEFDGLPVGFGHERSARWRKARAQEERRLRHGRSALSPYALRNEVEFLAVAAEAFFQTPRRLRASSSPLYRLMADYLLQDPAAWSDRTS